jgi:hypothetical protein
MKRLLLSTLLISIFLTILNIVEAKKQPKVVLLLVVDALSYNELIKVWDNLGHGGIRKLAKHGIFYRNNKLGYFQTDTATGNRLLLYA